jgi:hypothetical protein
MTRDYWNKYVAGHTWFARPMLDEDDRVWLIPTHAGEYKLTFDDLLHMGEIGFSMSLDDDDDYNDAT